MQTLRNSATRRRRRRRQPKIPRAATRRVLSPQPPSAVERYLAASYRRAVGVIGRKLWETLEPLLPAIAMPEPEAKLDAPADGSGGGAVAEKVVKDLQAQTKAAIEGASKVASKRADRHSQNEMGRLGIKISEASPNVAKLIPSWRKENVDRITGMVDDQLGKIRRILDDGGNHRVETLAKEIRRQCIDVSASRAELIARDQVLSLNAQITKARQTDAGIEKYVWTTSNDERVREEHQALEGQTFSWDDPPSVGHPGEDYQCRCVAFPILPELDDEEPKRPTAGPSDGEDDVAAPPVEPPAPPGGGGGGSGGDDGGSDDEGPKRVNFVAHLTKNDLAAIASEVEGDIEKVTKEIFGGRCPDAQSLRRTWEPPAGYRLHFNSFKAQKDGSLRVSADIQGSDGKSVGTAIRSFSREDGELLVNHEYFELDEAHQGGGFGKVFTRNALQSYREMGVDRVVTDAHWVGRYTWAKFGWNWPAPFAPRWRDQLERYLTKLARYFPKELGTPEKIKRLAQTAMQGAPTVARLEIGGRKVGKAFLLNKQYVPNWLGELRLRDGDVGYETAKKELGL